MRGSCSKGRKDKLEELLDANKVKNSLKHSGSGDGMFQAKLKLH